MFRFEKKIENETIEIQTLYERVVSLFPVSSFCVSEVKEYQSARQK